MTQAPAIIDKDRRSLFAAVCLSGVGEALAIGIAAFAMREVFYALHNGTSLPVDAKVTLALCALAGASFRFASRSASERLGQSYAITLRRELYRQLAGQSQSKIDERRAGALGLRFVGDLSAFRNWAGKGLTDLSTALIVLPGAGLTLWFINPDLATAAVPLVLLLCLVMIGAAIALGPTHRGLRSRRARIAIKMMERVPVAPLLHRMRRTRREIKDLDKSGQDLTVLAVKRARILGVLKSLPEIGLAMAGLAVIWTAFRNDAAPAEVAVALALLAILITPIRNLAGVWDRLSAWRIAREKYELVQAQPSRRRSPGTTAGAAQIGLRSIKFRGIEADLSIPAGNTVLITGPSGSGKTSLLRLAAGLERPESGSVSYGDAITSPRAVIVGQDGPILQGSLRRALCLGARKYPDDERIESVARQMGLSGLMERIGGLSGRLGEHGRTVSEGEVVRILLGRVKLVRPNIVVVDTPMMDADETLRLCLKEIKHSVGMTLLIASITGNGFDFVDQRLSFIGTRAIDDYRAAVGSERKLSA